MFFYYKVIRPSVKRIYYWLSACLLNTISYIFFWIKPRAIDSEQVKKILIIKMERIGDLVLSTPAIRSIRNNFPNSYIAMVTTPYTKAVVEKDPHINEILEFNSRWNLKEKFSFIKHLKKQRFNIAIDLTTRNNQYMPAWVLFFSGSEATLGLNNYGRAFLYNIRVKPLLEPKAYPEEVMHILSPLGIKTSDFQPRIFVSQRDRDFMQEHFNRALITSSDTVVTIHPGGYYESLRWEKAGYAKITQHLIEKYNAKVFFIGTENEHQWVEEIIALISSSEKPIDVTGEFSLGQIMALISQSHLFIGNSSGPLHIACGFDIPTVSFLGPSIPQRWWPQGNKNIVFRGKLSEGLYELEYSQNRDYKKLNRISSEEVIKAVDKQLREHAYTTSFRKRKKEIIRILNLLLQRNIPFILLRKYEFLYDDTIKTPSEIDILVPYTAYRRIRKLFYEQQFYCQHSLRHCGFSRFTPQQKVSFDFQFEYIHELNMPYLSYSECLPFVSQVAGYTCLSDIGLLVHLLIHCAIGKANFEQGYREKIHNLFKLPNAKVETIKLLLKYLPKKTAKYIVCCAEESKFSLLEKKRWHYALLFLSKDLKGLVSLIKFVLHKLKQKYNFLGRGVVIAFIGLDGTGKTTLSRKLGEVLRGFFGYRTRYVYMGRVKKHVLPLNAVAKKVGISQRKQGKQPGKLYLFFRDAIYSLDMFLRYIFYIFPYKVSNHMVICDRYAYDMYLDKYQTALSRWIFKHLYPRANVLVFLTLPEGEIIRRKNEYDAQHRQFLLERWQRVAKEFNSHSLISEDIEKSITVVYDLIQRHLFEKQWTKSIIKTHHSVNALSYWFTNIVYPKLFSSDFGRKVLFRFIVLMLKTPLRYFLHWLYLDYRLFSVRFLYTNNLLSRIISNIPSKDEFMQQGYIYSFLCKGWRKNLVFSFSDRQKEPLCVSKIAADNIGEERLRNESNMLSRVRSLDEYLSKTTPNILHEGSSNNRLIVLESAGKGNSLLTYLCQENISLSELDNIFLNLRQWLTLLHKKSCSEELEGKAFLRDVFRESFASYSRATSLTEEERRTLSDLFNTMVGYIEKMPTVFQHRDFQPDNILYNRDSNEITVVDWEYSISKGLLLIDFLNMMSMAVVVLSQNTYYTQLFMKQSRYSLMGEYAVTPGIFRNIFYQHTRISDMIKKHILEYCEGFNIDTYSLKVLFLLYILQHTLAKKNILKVFLQDNKNILWEK